MQDFSDNSLNSVSVWLAKHAVYADRESKQLVEGNDNSEYDALALVVF